MPPRVVPRLICQPHDVAGMFSPLLPTRPALPSAAMLLKPGSPRGWERMYQFSSDGVISSTYDLESIRVGSLEQASLTNGQGERGAKSLSLVQMLYVIRVPNQGIDFASGPP